MRALFTFFTTAALRFRILTVVAIVLVLGFGLQAVTLLNQELLPPIEFPQTIILTQVSGMTSDEVLTVVTERLEQRLSEIEEVVNLETTTTGAFGAVLIARNDFGINQVRLLEDIQTALDSVWLPQRRIVPPAGEAPQAFAARLLADVQPELLIYLQSRDANFLFQLTPDVWSALSEDTARAALAYLANQVEVTDVETSALRRLVEQQIVPEVSAIDLVANVSVGGGQVLPGETTFNGATEADGEAESLVLKLSPKVWAVVAPRLGLGTELNAEMATELAALDYPTPEGIPALPESWQMDHFADASDLRETTGLGGGVAASLNAFVEDGRIVGSLGKTNDLTPETVTQMLEIAPSLVNAFEAEHLAAMPPEVFAVLPDAYLAGLDGFTRDALAARAIAIGIAGEAAATPVDLPAAWRIAPPRIITFSFADLPLATFSISTTATGEAAAEASAESESAAQTEDAAQTETVTATATPTAELPEGPAVPAPLALLGTFLGVELNTADDLVNIQLPENIAAQFGGDSLSSGQLLGFLILLANPEDLPEGVQLPPIPINVDAIFSGFTPEAGLTEVDLYEAEFRVRAINAANQVIVLIDSSKFGQVELTPSVRPDRISHLFSDRSLSPDWVERLQRANLAFTLCE